MTESLHGAKDIYSLIVLLMKRTLEICCDTIQSVINANEAGADRIELCSALSTGGITPTSGFVKEAIRISHIPINILLRPRAGNFVYNNEEFRIMCDDIEEMKNLGVNGIVSGILLNNGKIDEQRTKILVDKTSPVEFTFHRGIDFSVDIDEGFETLIKIGAKRVLTSGGSAKIDGGIDNLIRLHSIYGAKIVFMPGGGLNLENALRLKNAGITEFHFSASEFESDNCKYSRNPDGLGHVFAEAQYGYNFSSVKRIKEMINFLR